MNERTDPEALYDEGMAFYRRRQWREAQACFERVKALQPNRRGIDALLSELSIFLQLESVEEAEAVQQVEVRADEPPVETPMAVPLRSTPSLRRSLWWALIVVLVTAVVVGGVFLYSSGRFSSIAQSKDARMNKATSLLLRQRCAEALGVFAELLNEYPEDKEVIHGLDQAKGCLDDQVSESEHAADVADDLGEAATHVDKALAGLRVIAAVDPEYRNARDRIERLGLLARVIQLHAEARAYLASQAYGDAIRRLQEIRSYDIEYRPGTIGDELYQAYMGRGALYLKLAADDLQPANAPKPEEPSYLISDGMLENLRRAQRDFEAAVSERRSSREAAQANALAMGIQEGLERYSDWAWEESSIALMAVYEADAMYFGGHVGSLLCDALVHQIRLMMQLEEIGSAVAARERMARVEGCAVGQVDALMVVLTPTATSTPTHTPTVTPTFTNTPRPSPTATVTPTDTSTPEPTPEPKSDGGDSKPKPTRPSRK
ncbi:MAG: tetratricopeptide repeat protein [Anaerolineae bacterium]|nr:tetratricopeptide repeat protein [Anaerolineae bacterium]